ncbi:ensconsin-like isoform X3 [Daphnia pulex]|uniref:ensconsin-like isoform X3 n=1 Tax=Daphnia pulex TaxID=6669 RepID=UPI001EDD38BA|nr:ensconsin-like isoform X3 [Daphnia pulex]
MSVGVGMGIGRGHVTLGHGVNLTGSNATPGSGVDGLDGGGGSEHDQISPTWSVQCWDTLGDQVDHLILLPERALTMDSGWLQADLAEILAHSVIGHGRGDGSSSGRDYSVTPFLSHPHERSSSSHDGSDSWFPHSRRRSLDWSLVNSSAGQPQSPFVAIATSADPGQESCSATAAAAAAAAAASAVQREERSKVLRERQNEERQRKLEELKQQALATQKFREQQEEERRRRMEEQRLRDLERRTQVEERKKAILEAERERREAMLRRSEDRGIRQETKRRNERGSIAFAFGSSTPRMLEPVDSCSSYWGSRRATSTTNVMSASSHGRVTLNEATTPNGGGNNNKLRASSVFGLDQNQGDDLMTQSTSAVQGGRRKRTDLIPTIPIHRGEGDRSPRSPLYGSSSGASSSRGSVNRSTGMSVSMSRLDQLSHHRRRLSQNQLPSPTTPLQPLHESEPQQPQPTASSSTTKTASNSSTRSSRPASRSHHPSAATTTTTTASSPSSPQGTIAARGNRSMSKSMSHLAPGRPSSSSANKAGAPSVDGSTPPPRNGATTTTTRAERLRQKARQHAPQRPQHGLRSGDITPSSPTRPLSALSQVSSVSTTVASSSASISGHVRARTAPAGGRKPRPVSIAGTGMSLSEAARTSRASRENINSRERSKETKEKENERTRQTQPTPATTPRPARARSADMRKDNNNAATHKSSPEGALSQPSHAKRPNRDAGRHPSARETKTPVKATAEAPKSAKGVKTEEGAATTGKANNKSVAAAAAATKKADEEAVKAVELVQVTVPPADSQPESKEVVNVKVEESHDPTAVETLPAAAETEMISMTDSTASGDAPDVEILPPVTTTNNDVAVVSTPSEVSNVEGQVSVDSIPSGATTPSETGSVSGDSVPLSLTSRKIISSEEEAKAALAEKRRLAREQMEREAERERLRAEEERLLEEERQRQEELEQKLAEEEMDRMALEARQAEEERLQKAIEETQRREEEERLRREEEARQRVEKEQQDRKAREEAEKLRKENEERLRREEEERQERRKRVEAIMARTRGKSSGPGSSNNKSGNELNNAVSSDQSASDVTSVGMMNNSISQPDLLGDIVNKSTSNGSGGGNNSNGQSSLSPDDDSLMDDDTTKQKNNGFHLHHNHHHNNQHIDATDSSSSLASTTSDLPDISNVTANADSDSVNSIASTNNITAEVEPVEFLA